MDSNHDDDTRIAQLEQELAALHPPRAKATRVAPPPAMPRRRLSGWMLVASLFAVSLPAAAWVHGQARSDLVTQVQRRALHSEAQLDLAARRQEIATRFLDVALDAGRSPDEQNSALRYLAEELGAKSKVRRWARKELSRTGGEQQHPCAQRRAAKARALREALAREHQAQPASSCGG